MQQVPAYRDLWAFKYVFSGFVLEKMSGFDSRCFYSAFYHFDCSRSSRDVSAGHTVQDLWDRFSSWIAVSLQDLVSVFKSIDLRG